jgi:hypothetical protein
MPRAGANSVWTELSILAANFDLDQSSTFCALPRAGANSVWTELVLPRTDWNQQ